MPHFSSKPHSFRANPIPSAFTLKWILGYAAAHRQVNLSQIGLVHLVLN